MENDIKTTEWIYIIQHDAYPKWYKLGRTSRVNPIERLDDYNAHTPFYGAFFIGLWQVENSRKVEELIIDYMHCNKYQIAKKEWFRNVTKKASKVSFKRLFAKISKHALREIELGTAKGYRRRLYSSDSQDTQSDSGESHGELTQTAHPKVVGENKPI